MAIQQQHLGDIISMHIFNHDEPMMKAYS